MTTSKVAALLLIVILCAVPFSAFATEGDSCESNEECKDEASYCKKADGDCDGEGTCEPRPEMCTAQHDPVCGCDGSDYSNACYAAEAGVNVDYEGECKAEDESASEEPGATVAAAAVEGR
jgi:hypothetical protein